MNTHRTVAWLAIFVVVTPFLAIPEWLMKALLTVFGIVIICTVWLTRPDTISQSAQNNSGVDDADDRDDTINQSTNTESASPSEDSQQQLDIEDPEADTMVAADRWRRRASRDIS